MYEEKVPKLGKEDAHNLEKWRTNQTSQIHLYPTILLLIAACTHLRQESQVSHKETVEMTLHVDEKNPLKEPLMTEELP